MGSLKWQFCPKFYGKATNHQITYVLIQDGGYSWYFYFSPFSDLTMVVPSLSSHTVLSNFSLVLLDIILLQFLDSWKAGFLTGVPKLIFAKAFPSITLKVFHGIKNIISLLQATTCTFVVTSRNCGFKDGQHASPVRSLTKLYILTSCRHCAQVNLSYMRFSYHCNRFVFYNGL